MLWRPALTSTSSPRCVVILRNVRNIVSFTQHTDYRITPVIFAPASRHPATVLENEERSMPPASCRNQVTKATLRRVEGAIRSQSASTFLSATDLWFSDRNSPAIDFCWRVNAICSCFIQAMFLPPFLTVHWGFVCALPLRVHSLPRRQPSRLIAWMVSRKPKFKK